MKHTINTRVDLRLSKKVIEKAMESYKKDFADYAPHFSWRTGPGDVADFGFSVKGIKLGGTMHVLDGRIDVDMAVPFIARPFQGRAMRIIDEHVARWVEKAKKGEI